MMERRVSITDLKAMKRRGEPIAMLTAYDYPSARLVEEAAVPIILVGDSLGMVVLGYDSTIPVTMEEMLHHVKAVVRGTRKAHIVADMPFMSYQAGPQDALLNAGRMLKEGGAQSVKLEGGPRVAERFGRVLLELGGNNAAIVTPSADLDLAVRGLAPERYYRALADLIDAADRDVDLIDLDDGSRLAAFLEAEGELLRGG